MRGAAGWRNGLRNTAIREIPKLIQSTGSYAFRSRKRAIMLNGYSKICKFIGRDSQRGSERKPPGLQRCRPTKALIEDHSFQSMQFPSVRVKSRCNPQCRTGSSPPARRSTLAHLSPSVGQLFGEDQLAGIGREKCKGCAAPQHEVLGRA